MGAELSRKVAVVTGGASGIGRATVELFAEQGAAVVVADVDEEQGAALATGLGDSGGLPRTDVSNADEIQALVDFAVETFGGLHVMVNNAGISSSFRRFLRDDLRDFDRVMAVNLFGVVIGTQRAGRHMAEHGGGSIINASSMGGLTGGGPPIVYRMSKASIVNFSRMVATDLAEFGIRVNLHRPGPHPDPDHQLRPGSDHRTGPAPAASRVPQRTWPRPCSSWPATARPRSPAPSSRWTGERWPDARSGRSCSDQARAKEEGSG